MNRIYKMLHGLEGGKGKGHLMRVDGSEIEFRWRRDFPQPSLTDTGSHPAFCAVDTEGKAAGALRLSSTPT